MISISAAVSAPMPKPSRSVGEVWGGESTQVTVVVHDLDGESEPATGERQEGMFRRGGRRIDRAAAPSAAACEERLVGERVEGLSQRGRRGDDDSASA